MTDADVPRLTPWIGGATTTHEGPWLDVVSPDTENVVASVANVSDAVVDRAVESASVAQVEWASRTPLERAAVLESVAVSIRHDVERLAHTDARDTGKSFEVAVDEMLGASRYFEYYAAELKTLSGVTIEAGEHEHTFIQRVPFGVVAVIVPWNYAANQTARSAAPALATGNAVVVKPSELASSAVLALAELATAAGLPDGLLNVVTGDGASVGTHLVEHPTVRRIAFTGSVATGRQIAGRAAERLVPISLELGGKSPHLVFGDADLDAVARCVVDNVTAFAGQTCSAGTRLLVEASVADDLVSRVLELLERLDLPADVGPLVSDEQRTSVRAAIEQAVAAGAVCLAGGPEPHERPGFYVSPTVLGGVTPSMRIFHEEVFGPVLTVTTFDTEERAIELANATSYGLVAAVWTLTLPRALRVASRMQCGQVFVNRWGASERVPFGGFGLSGLGREKGASAMAEYTQTRAVTIDVS